MILVQSTDNQNTRCFEIGKELDHYGKAHKAIGLLCFTKIEHTKRLPLDTACAHTHTPSIHEEGTLCALIILLPLIGTITEQRSGRFRLFFYGFTKGNAFGSTQNPVLQTKHVTLTLVR